MLCWRHSYVAQVGPLPTAVRPLAAPTRQKRLVYLELAQIILRKYPTESTARSIAYLLKLCRNEPPEPLVELQWLQEPPREDIQINIEVPSSLARLAPVMRFNALHR